MGLIVPSLEEIALGRRGMLAGIKATVDTKCLVSAVTLMFASVDALAALTRPIGQQDTSGQDFMTWAERYLIKVSGLKLKCDKEDLWGARCGILHTYGHESRYRRQGKANPLFYEWQAGPKADSYVTLPSGAIVLTVETFHKAVIDGILQFVEDYQKDPETDRRVKHHLQDLLCYVACSPI